MSDDEADPELLELLRQSLGLSNEPQNGISSDTGVLKDSEFIYANAVDVSIDMYNTKAAAASIYAAMQERGYSIQSWSEHELHPKASEGFSDLDITNFVFIMDLLNFSFWSERSETERFQVDYRGKRWTGYNSLVACLRRSLDEGIPITNPRFWNHQSCSDRILAHIFRSATDEQIPLLDERMSILREAGIVLQDDFGDLDHEQDLGEAALRMEEESYADGHTGRDDLEDERAVIEQPILNGNVAEQSTNTTTATDGSLPTAARFSSSAGPEQVDRDAVDLAWRNAATPAENGVHGSGADPEMENMPQATIESHPHMETATFPQIKPDYSIVRLIQKADRSAGKLVNLLARHFASFRDETHFEGKKVRLLKRAQILVADLWAAFNGTSYGAFNDIAHLTTFPDYRVPQMLCTLGVLTYSPPLDNRVRALRQIPSGHSWEVQIRGCSVWAVELLRREMLRQHAESTGVHAVLIDFFLYDLAKEREAAGK